jgi:hypothetical protein
MRVAIFLTSFGNHGQFLAHVSQRGKVKPAKGQEATDNVAGIEEHLKRILKERPKLTGRAFLERVQRSYTNGYMVADIVR